MQRCGDCADLSACGGCVVRCVHYSRAPKERQLSGLQYHAIPCLRPPSLTCCCHTLEAHHTCCHTRPFTLVTPCHSHSFNVTKTHTRRCTCSCTGASASQPSSSPGCAGGPLHCTQVRVPTTCRHLVGENLFISFCPRACFPCSTNRKYTTHSGAAQVSPATARRPICVCWTGKPHRPTATVAPCTLNLSLWQSCTSSGTAALV
jgi:hypothetical protein